MNNSLEHIWSEIAVYIHKMNMKGSELFYFGWSKCKCLFILWRKKLYSFPEYKISKNMESILNGFYWLDYSISVARLCWCWCCQWFFYNLSASWSLLPEILQQTVCRFWRVLPNQVILRLLDSCEHYRQLEISNTELYAQIVFVD